MSIRNGLLTIIALHIMPACASAAPLRAGAGVPILAPAPVASPTAPVLATDARWVSAMLIIMCASLLAAGVIGPLYRMSLPEAMPQTHSHDEPPGASHHHGPSGTIEHDES